VARWTLWVFAAALLLKAAMPFLATASAHMQGKALVEVCTAYGVALVSPDGEPHEHPADPESAQHGGDHCVLSALPLLASGEAPALAPLGSNASLVLEQAPRPAAAPLDAIALWAALQKHGPPAQA
jgi:hypothetical protein